MVDYSTASLDELAEGIRPHNIVLSKRIKWASEQITANSARIAELEAELATTRHYEQQWRDAEKKIAELENSDREAELDKLRHRTAVDELNITALDSRLTIVTAQRDVALEALKPFADHSALYDNVAGGYPDENVCCNRVGGAQNHVVTIGDFRRTRSVLASIAEKDAQG